MKRLVGCPCAVQLFDLFEDRDHAHLVMELCTGSDLRRHLRAARGALPEAEAAEVMHSVLQFLADCEQHGVMYGDVKPANFLLKFDVSAARPAGLAKPPLVVKGVDFGCSQLLPPGGKLSRRTGTPAYWAPEVFLCHYDHQADAWSAGVLLYELLCGRLPFWDSVAGCSPKDIQQGVLYGTVDEGNARWRALSPEARDLALALLDRDPATRPTARACLDHPWLVRHGQSHPEDKIWL